AAEFGIGSLLAVAAVPVLAVIALGVLLLLTDRRADRAADQAVDAASRLLAFSVPSNVDAADCTTAEPGGDVVRELSCGPTVDGEGPTSGTYSVVAGDGAADAFAADVAAQELDELADVFECGSGEDTQGWTSVTDVDTDGDEVEVGRLACWVDDDGDSVLSWTWPDIGARSVVELRGGGGGGLSDLRSWWDSTADRGY
ncbi:hypothetical protein, partial [Modestobacter versicolor]